MSFTSSEFIFTIKKKTKPTYFAFKIYPDQGSGKPEK